MKPRAVIGVDGGLNGAFAIVDEDNELVDYWDMPIIVDSRKITRGPKKGKVTTKRKFDPRGMFDELEGRVMQLTGTYYLESYIEVAHAMPQQGVSSTFKTGEGYGLIQMLVVSLGLDCNYVRAVEWQKAMTRSNVKGDTKERSLKRASDMFPDLVLTKPRGRVLSLDGRSDAALIAAYGIKIKGTK